MVQVLTAVPNTSGDVINYSAEFTGEPPLEWLQKQVGGWIEVVHLPKNEMMIVNEEGLLHNLPLNVVASCVAGQPIVGNAVVLSAPHLLT